MKKIYGLMLLVMLSFSGSIMAYDFKANNADGIPVLYTVLSEEELTVMCVGVEFPKKKGRFSIPETVEYDGKTYTVTAIGGFEHPATKNRTKIEELEIPATVVDIKRTFFGEQNDATAGIGVFASVDTETGPSRVTVAKDNPVYDSRDNCNAIIETATNRLIWGCKDSTIPSTVTTIGGYAFAFCYARTTCNIPENVTLIEKFAFDGCVLLQTIIIPSTCKLETGVFRSIQQDKDAPEYIFFSAKDPSTITGDIDELLYLFITESKYYDYWADHTYLYIPKGSYDAYAADPRFAKVLEYLCEVDWYDLTVSDAGLATMYLDFPVDIPTYDGNLLGVFYGKNINNNKLLMSKFTSVIPEENGVLVMANPGTYRFIESFEDYGYPKNILTGVLEDTPVETVKANEGYREILTLGQGKTGSYIGFYKFTGETLGANKAFLGLEQESEQAVNALSMTFDEEETTGVSDLIPSFTREKKTTYDLSGRRVSRPTRGLYIVNGKKVLY